MPVITVNNAWKLAPWADVVYAGDFQWWDHYGVKLHALGQRWTCNKDAARKFNLNFHHALGPYNSGHRAIQLALMFNAARILLLGYDCSLKHGVHFDGKHVGLGNPKAPKCLVWAKQFAALSKTALGKIVNCSRYTELDCFPRSALETELRVLT